MDNFEEKVWSYGLLTPAEQAQIDGFVSTHPDYGPMLDEIKGLYALLRETQLMETEPLADTALAYFIANENLQSGSAPAGMRTIYDVLKKKVESDFEVFERYQAIKANMETVASLSNPVAEFERLTGVDVNQMPAVSQPPLFTGEKKERPPIVREHAVFGGRRTKAGLFLLAISIVVFFIALQANKLERMAYLNADAFNQQLSELRGVYPSVELSESGSNNPETLSSEELNARFNEGLNIFFQSQKIKFLFFRDYDLAGLQKAEKLFRDILNNDRVNPVLVYEVKYVLAKVYIARHRIEEAQALLKEVAQQEGRWSNNAQNLLERI